MTDSNIEHIVELFTNYQNVDYKSALVDNDVIGSEQDYNLSVSTYVEQEDTREKIDIDVLNKEIAETVAKIDHLRAEIDKIVEELSYGNDVILYRTDDGESAIELHLDNGTVWLTQQELAELFQTSKQNISKHIKAIFEDGELSEEATVNYKLTVQNEGNRSVQRNVAYYNLDMILAIGYRYIKNIFKKVKKS